MESSYDPESLCPMPTPVPAPGRQRAASAQGQTQALGSVIVPTPGRQPSQVVPISPPQKQRELGIPRGLGLNGWALTLGCARI